MHSALYDGEIDDNQKKLLFGYDRDHVRRGDLYVRENDGDFKMSDSDG